MPSLEDLDAGVREFPLGTVLSVTDAQTRLFSPDGIRGVRDLLTYLVGETVEDNQLPRVIDEVRDEILRQHPFLKDDPNMAPPEDFERESIQNWLGWLSIYAGETLGLLPLRPEDHTSIDPYDEWAMQKGSRNGIVIVEIDDDQEE